MPQVNKWRLSKTLKRKTEYRPVDQSDIKYIWAAYKKGSLKEFNFKSGLEPDELQRAFSEIVLSNCQMAWTLIATTSRGFIPVGVVLCAWAPLGTHLVVLGLSWMPWATKRNVVESCVGFFNKARKEFQFVGYALPEHKRMYEVCAMHGVMRRVGTSYIAIPGEHCAVFETRKINVVPQ